METFKNIETRRSVRAFDDKPVEKTEIERMVQAAILAPTWKNSQTVRYVAVTDKLVMEKISKTLIEHNSKIVSASPLLMVVSSVTGRSGFNTDGTPSSIYGEGYTFFDCGAAVENLCLAANEMGIGTVILGMFDPEKLREILSISDSEAPIVLVACGYNTAELTAPKKRKIEEVLRII